VHDATDTLRQRRRLGTSTGVNGPDLGKHFIKLVGCPNRDLSADRRRNSGTAVPGFNVSARPSYAKLLSEWIEKTSPPNVRPWIASLLERKTNRYLVTQLMTKYTGRYVQILLVVARERPG
jgi:hypothetical protein